MAVSKSMSMVLGMVACLGLLAGSARADWVTGVPAPGNGADGKPVMDPEGRWDEEKKASDGDSAKYAIDKSNRVGAGAPLVLSFPGPDGEGVYADQLRVNADFWPSITDKVVIKVWRFGATEWETVHSAAVLNATYQILALPNPGKVQMVQFQFNYVKSGYYFWLYELQLFRVVTPVVAPAACTLEPSNVNATSAVLHGMVAHQPGDKSEVPADGGELCKVWFKYGTAPGALGTETEVQSGFGSGAEAAAYITGLTLGQQYYYQVCVQNTVKTTTGQVMSFVACPEESDDGSVWVSPIGTLADTHTYGTTPYSWETPGAAHDDWDESAARCYHEILDPELWSPYLYLHPAPGIYSGLRFKAAKPDSYIDSIQVEVLKSSGWETIYQGAFAHNTWEVKPFEPYPVQDVRVRFHMSKAGVGQYWTLYEFDFRQIGVNLISPRVPYSREENPGVCIVKDGASSPLLFKFGPGVELLTSGTVTVSKSDNLKLIFDTIFSDPLEGVGVGCFGTGVVAQFPICLRAPRSNGQSWRMRGGRAKPQAAKARTAAFPASVRIR